MTTQNIERLYDKIDSLKDDISEIKSDLSALKAEFKIHQDSKPKWYTYLLFIVAGALLSQGPEGIKLLAKFVGLGI